MPEAVTLQQLLSEHTKEGILYEKLPDQEVRCFSCGHRCLIREGRDGICRIRFNRGGVLYVPTGYVGALQCDPIEKKPFFHAFPGRDALSFGMLGCDFHCGYCLTSQVFIITEQGPVAIGELFSKAEIISEANGTSIAHLKGLSVYTHTGEVHPVKALFKHKYQGDILELQTYYQLPLELTPDHEVLAIHYQKDKPLPAPSFLPAKDLTPQHYLAIPKNYNFSHETVFDLAELLKNKAKPIRHKRILSRPFLEKILDLTKQGLSSREIGRLVSKSPSHVRHLRSKVQNGKWNLDNLFTRPGQLLIEENRVRFSKERGPGTLQHIPLDEKLAELFGYYCAEGCVLHDKDRVLAAEVVFAVGLHETKLAERIQDLVQEIFGVKAQVVKRNTTLGVILSKSSVALFFEEICGTGSQKKRVPTALYQAHRPVVEAFIAAYVKGDGHCYPNGKISITTVSENLATGLQWLLLKTGRLPQLIKCKQDPERKIIGRSATYAPFIYFVNWYPTMSRRSFAVEDSNYFYIKIKRIHIRKFDDYVYNMEVEKDHSYLASCIATHNCQNWITSQAIRDPNAIAPPQYVTPEELVRLAKKYHAPVLASTYNEPLITSEWAVEVFQVAKREGLKCAYISNGNGTPEVLQFIRPWVDLYKVDLKSFDDRHYRQLGGVLKVVLETIERLKVMGFWLEIVTLTIPGFNDSDEELASIAKFLVSVSPEIPWHVTAFHKDYKMTDPENTSTKTLLRAAQIGEAAGLKFVYAGNLPGQVGRYENTHCPTCKTVLIERYGYTILRDLLTPSGGMCPKCKQKIPGVWN